MSDITLKVTWGSAETSLSTCSATAEGSLKNIQRPIAQTPDSRIVLRSRMVVRHRRFRRLARRGSAAGRAAATCSCVKFRSFGRGVIAVEIRKGRVLVLDDVRLRRQLVSANLSNRGHTVLGESAKLISTSLVDMFEPDAVVVELNGDSPVKVVSLLRLSGPRRVVFVAAHDSCKTARVAAAHAGADAIFIEPFDIDEMVALVETMMSWGTRSEPSVRANDLVVDVGAHTVTRGGMSVDLTLTEFKLLAEIARHVGVVMSKRHLLEHVWGFGDYDPNVVEVHVCALRKKLAGTGADLIETVRGVGYVIRRSVVLDSTANCSLQMELELLSKY